MNTKLPPSTNPPRTFSPELQLFLAGRTLLLNELPFSEKEINLHIKHGTIEETPGLSRSSKGWVCHRCNNGIQRLLPVFPCASCARDCVYCRKCLMMGRVSQCTSFYRWTGPAIKSLSRESCLQWDGQLSEGQEAASEAVVSTVRDKAELLVWAV